MIEDYQQLFIDSHAYHVEAHNPLTLQVLVGLDTWGIHPWDLKHPVDHEHIDQLFKNNQIDHERVIAIGECGLDRVHEPVIPIEDQIYVLKKHLELSQHFKKPAIIHSVRAYSDLLGVLKKHRPKVPLLMHAYGGNEYEMNELLKYPCFFSFGGRLVHNTVMIKKVPLNRLLLETGDQTEIKILEIYQLAANALAIELEELKKIIFSNFLAFYGFSDLNDPRAADFFKKLHRRARL